VRRCSCVCKASASFLTCPICSSNILRPVHCSFLNMPRSASTTRLNLGPPDHALGLPRQRTYCGHADSPTGDLRDESDGPRHAPKPGMKPLSRYPCQSGGMKPSKGVKYVLRSTQCSTSWLICFDMETDLVLDRGGPSCPRAPPWAFRIVVLMMGPPCCFLLILNVAFSYEGQPRLNPSTNGPHEFHLAYAAPLSWMSVIASGCNY